jgi:hypothetical protein
MFKELKVLKLSLFALILILIIVNINFEKYSGVVWFSSQPSYELGHKIEISTATTQQSSFDAHFTIKNAEGTLIKEQNESVNLELSNPELSVSDGFLHTFSFDITEYIKKTGIYFINDSLPFFVHSNQPKDITVIYPSVGNLLLNKTVLNNENAFGHLTAKIWKNRPVTVDEKSANLIHFLSTTFPTKKIEFVSDLDPLLGNVIAQSKMVVVYGYCRYATESYWQAISNYIKNNGKVVFMNSYLPEYLLAEPSPSQLAFAMDQSGHFIYLGDSLLPFHFKYGGFANELEYSLNDKAIFGNTSKLKIQGLGNVFVGSKNAHFLAEMKTIYETKEGKTGIMSWNNQLFSVGTEEWLSSENMGNSETKKVTQQLFEYVLQ